MHKKHRRRVRSARVVAAAAGLVWAGSARITADAADRFWVNTVSGLFGTPGNASSNWSATSGGAGGATAPNTGDTANFTLGGTYTVTFAGPVTNQVLEVANGNVTFDLGGNAYTLTTGVAIRLGAVPSQTARLTVVEGILAVGAANDNVQIGHVTNAPGFLTIGGDGQLGTAAVRPLMLVGDEANGTLTVQANGKVFASAMTVGSADQTTGNVNLTGPQALLDITIASSIGSAGTGVVQVSAGADFLSSSSITLGSTTSGVGTLTLTGAGSTWTQTGPLTVANNGHGTLSVQSAAQLNTGGITVGGGAGSFGTATVSGAGSAAIASSLTVGNSGEGGLTISGAARVSLSSTATVGSNATGRGSVTVSGVDSILEMGSTLTVGNSGTGTLLVSGGGNVRSVSGVVGGSASGTGEATISGAGSSWKITNGNLSIASAGAGTLTVKEGGDLTVSGNLSVNDPVGSPFGTLNFHGGSITVTNFARAAGATFNWTDGTLTVDGGVYNNNGAALVLNGAVAGDRPTLRLAGDGQILGTNVGALTVGNNRGAGLEVTGGTLFQVSSINIGALDGGDGVATVSGSFSSLQSTGDINLGGTSASGGGAGSLTVRNGSSVSTAVGGAFRVWPGGTVNLDGGSIAFGSLDLRGGKVNFNAGNLQAFTGFPLTDSVLDAVLGPSHTLLPGRTILNSGVDAFLGTDLDVNGGNFFGVHTSGPGVDGGAVLTVNGGFNPVVLRVRGGGSVQFSEGITLGAGSRTYVEDGILGPGFGGTLTQQGELHLSSTALISASTLVNTGLVTGSGRIDATFTNNTGGQVRAASGERMVLNGNTTNNGTGRLEVSAGGELELLRNLTNNSTVDVIGGTLRVQGTATNGASTGRITARDAVLRFPGGLTNHNQLAFSFGTSDLFGALTNSASGRVIVTGNSEVTFYDAITHNGTFQVSAGSTAVFLGAVGGSGTFSGTGTKLFESGTTILAAPLASGGDTFVEAAASLTAPSLREDELVVRGDVTTTPGGGTSRLTSLTVEGGTFDLSDNAVVIKSGDLSELHDLIGAARNASKELWQGDGITTSAAIDELTTLALVPNSSLKKGSFRGVTLDPTDFIIVFALTADTDFDKRITADDYHRIDAGFLARAGEYHRGDFNYDGRVGLDDYALIDAAFLSPVSAVAAAVAAVPEPAGGVLMLPALLWGRRRRKGNQR